MDVWKEQPRSFFAQPARIDADGSIVATTGVRLRLTSTWSHIATSE